MKLPKNTIWKQDNNSDIYGDIWCSWNLDLTAELGKIKTTRMLSVARSIDDDTANYVNGLGVAAAFKYYDGQYFAATHGTISACGSSRTDDWALVDTADKPTTVSSLYSDMEIFNEILYVSLAGTNLSKNNAGTWGTVAITGGASNIPHMMCKFADRLYVVADAGKINSMNTSEAFATTIGTSSYTLNLTDPTSNTITFLRATSDKIWIGTVNQLGGNGCIYAWGGTEVDGSDLEIYNLESSGAMAGVVKDDVLYVMDNDGRLLAFNGGTFIKLDRIPFATGKYGFFALGNYNQRWIHPNGMTIKDNSVLILIDNEYRGNTPSWEENVHSGIWEWTKETGLYHKYSLSLTNHDATSVKDYGQSKISSAGALVFFKSASTDADDNGSLLASSQLFYSGSSTENHIFIDDLNNTIRKCGHLITPKIFSTNLKDIWQKIFLRIKQFTTSGDQIIIKYRTSEATPTEIIITTWSGSNSVKTSTSISDYAAGDEIEFLQGEGAGRSFKILSIADLGSGVSEIFLDGSFVGLSGAAGRARLQHWKQIGVAFTSTVDSLIEKPILEAGSSTWIQFKIEIMNTGNSYIYDITLENKVNQNK
jgi:hypothetical protein